MKHLKFALFLLFFSQSLMANGQLDDTLGLKRFFWGIVPSTIIESNVTTIIMGKEGYEMKTGGVIFDPFGLQFEIGNYWILAHKKRTTGFFRLTWTKIGIQNYGLLLAPAQVGFGTHFDFNKRSSLDVVLNGGLIMATEDRLDPTLIFNYAVYPQVKYNFNRFSVGVEYTFRKRHSHSTTSLESNYHYVGLVLGGTVGKRINE